MTISSALQTDRGGSEGVGASATQSGWLFGPAVDLVLGCGVGSIAVSVLMVFQANTLAALVPGAILVLLFSLPHYGATLLRVYELREDRRRYAFFAFGVTTLLGFGFIAGLENVFLGSLLLTVYLTWSPWHYTGQNYGIFLILARRRGIAVSPVVKRLVYASFVLSYALTFLAIHGTARPENYAPASYAGTVYRLLPLGIPSWVSNPLLWGVAAAYGATLVAWFAALWRASSLRQLGPSLVVAGTQSLWFSVPVLMRFSGLARPDSGMAGIYDAYGFLWIAAAHAIQYLWITSYYAKSQGRARVLPSYLAKTAAAGFAIWTVPALVFAPGILGSLPHEAGLAVLIAAVVNLHHFVLDGVVWKLRDGNVARVLLREVKQPTSSAGPTRRRRWPRSLFWATGGVCVAVGLLALWGESEFKQALREQDSVRARAAVDQLSWLGRDGPEARTRLGRLYARQGRSKRAESEFHRSLALRPTVEAWRSLGLLYEEGRDWNAVVRAYDALLTMAPADGQALYRRGLAYLERGEPQKALADIDGAARLHPEQKIIGLSRQRAQRMIEESRVKEAAPRPTGPSDSGLPGGT